MGVGLELPGGLSGVGTKSFGEEVVPVKGDNTVVFCEAELQVLSVLLNDRGDSITVLVGCCAAVACNGAPLTSSWILMLKGSDRGEKDESLEESGGTASVDAALNIVLSVEFSLSSSDSTITSLSNDSKDCTISLSMSRVSVLSLAVSLNISLLFEFSFSCVFSSCSSLQLSNSSRLSVYVCVFVCHNALPPLLKVSCALCSCSGSLVAKTSYDSVYV